MKIKDIHKVEKKNSISFSVFVYKNKGTYLMCQKKCFKEKHVDLLLMGEKGKKKTCSYQRFYYIYV